MVDLTRVYGTVEEGSRAVLAVHAMQLGWFAGVLDISPQFTWLHPLNIPSVYRKQIDGKPRTPRVRVRKLPSPAHDFGVKLTEKFTRSLPCLSRSAN